VHGRCGLCSAASPDDWIGLGLRSKLASSTTFDARHNPPKINGDLPVPCLNERAFATAGCHTYVSEMANFVVLECRHAVGRVMTAIQPSARQLAGLRHGRSRSRRAS
jgi:hypothetical protein